MIQNLENEVWKDIKGYEGCYQVSNKGRIKSLPRYTGATIECCNEDRLKAIFEKKYKNSSSYLVVSLCKNNKGKNYYVHRLVAEAFIPNPDNKETVNHIDGNKHNNTVENLEWNTYKENNNHAWKTGLIQSQKGKTTKRVYQFDLDGNLLNIYPNQREAARQTGVACQNISLALKKGWHFGGFIWCYSNDVNEDKEKKKKVCKYCGKEFYTDYITNEYCSDECRREAKRINDKIARQRKKLKKQLLGATI